MMKQQSKMVWIYLFLLAIFNVNSMEINQKTPMINDKQNETQEKLKKYFPFYKEIMVDFPYCDGNKCQHEIREKFGMAAALTNAFLTELMINPVFPTIGYFIGILQVSLRSTYNPKSAIFFVVLNSALYVWGRNTLETYGEKELDFGEFIDSKSNRMFWVFTLQLFAEFVRASRGTIANIFKKKGELEVYSNFCKPCNKYVLPVVHITNSIMPMFQLPDFFNILSPLSLLQTIDPENAILLLFVNIHAMLTFGADDIVTNPYMIFNYKFWFGFLCVILQIFFVKYRKNVLAKNTTNALYNV